MDAGKRWVQENPLIAGIAAVGVILILVMIIQRLRSNEGFRDTGEGFSQQVAANLPMSIAFTTEHCPIVKQALTGYTNLQKRLEKADDSGGVGLKNVQTITAFYTNMYEKLNCKEYMAKLEAGEVAAGKSTRDDIKTLDQMVKEGFTRL